ncbi:MAG TPA: hypothetical protein VG298_00440 [Acidimicrobiales bacterium]|jgi:hypothetical protein|nr:hypothetical protein [Acidimicrobiales bacterium]
MRRTEQAKAMIKEGRRPARRAVSRPAQWLTATALLSVGALQLVAPVTASASGATPVAPTTTTTTTAPATTSTSSTSASSAGAGFGTFNALGRSDGLSIEVDDPSAPIVSNGQLIFASDSSSQAQLDSLGQSQAFSSVPYPGPLVASLPNLVNGLFSGQIPPLPSYPLYVSSQYPTAPSDVVNQGPYEMDATSGTSDAKALGIIGAVNGSPSVANLSSSAEAVQNADGSVTATADNALKGLDFGPGSLLQVDGVQSSATATQSPGQSLQTSSTLSVATLSIAGIGLSITDKGLAVDGHQVAALGLTQTITTLLHALSTQGLTLTYLPAKQLPDGVQSAALEIQEQKNIPGQGNVVVTLTIGAVMATIDSTVAPTLPETSALLPPTTPLVLPSLSAPFFGGPSSGSGLATASGTTNPTGGAISHRLYEFVRKALNLRGSASLLYLVLLAGALVVLLETELFRRLGVQLRIFRRPGRTPGGHP